MLRFDVSNNEKELDHLKKLLNEQETNKQNKRAEIEKYITAAREAMERERQDRYLLLVEQNKLKHKVEKLSETCKSYQVCIDFTKNYFPFFHKLAISLLRIGNKKYTIK